MARATHPPARPHVSTPPWPCALAELPHGGPHPRPDSTGPVPTRRAARNHARAPPYTTPFASLKCLDFHHEQQHATIFVCRSINKNLKTVPRAKQNEPYRTHLMRATTQVRVIISRLTAT